MVSTLKKRGDIYYCSNCQMRQFEIKPNCIFCGNSFSNYSSIIIENWNEAEKEEVKNEGSISGRSVE